jgi:hypothetical protein
LCLLKNRERPPVRKSRRHGNLKANKKKLSRDYLIEDPSIRHEAHSRWEAEDIYDEDDFKD